VIDSRPRQVQFQGEGAVSGTTALNRNFALVLAWASITAIGIGFVPALLLSLDTLNFTPVFIVGFVTILESIALSIIYRGYAQQGMIALAVINMISTVAPNFPAPLVSATLAVMMTAAFAPSVPFVVTTAIVIVRFAIDTINLALNNPGMILNGNTSLSKELASMFALTLVAVITRYFITNARNAALSAERSTTFLQAGAEIGQVASAMTDLRALLPAMVNLISERFNLYYVRVFLMDEGTAQLKLNAASGDTTSQTITRGEQPIAVGAPGAVGQAALRARMNIVRMNDANIEREGWLLHTHAQAAFPLMDGDQLVGVLEVQSREDDAFAATDVQALEIAVSQVANAIRTTRSFDQQVRVSEDNRRLAAASRQSLEEIERLNRQLTGVAWQSYLNRVRLDHGEPGITLDGDRLTASTEWSPSLNDAGRRRQPVHAQTTAHKPIVAVPLILRGEVIGAIEVEGSTDASSSQVVELTQAVAGQLAVSLENARLYEETGYAAAQEQRINAIAARFQQTTNIDDLLRITLSELSTALGAEHGAIRLTRLQSATAPANENEYSASGSPTDKGASNEHADANGRDGR